MRVQVVLTDKATGNVARSDWASLTLDDVFKMAPVLATAKGYGLRVQPEASEQDKPFPVVTYREVSSEMGDMPEGF